MGFGLDMVATFMSSFVDILLLTYLYKNCEKRNFFKIRFMLAVFVYVIVITSAILLDMSNGIRMCLLSFTTLSCGVILFKGISEIIYVKNTIVMFVCVNIADVLTVMPIWFIQNTNSVDFLNVFWVWCISLLISRCYTFLMIRIIHKFQANNYVQKGRLESVIHFFLFAGLYLFIIYTTVIMLLDKDYSREFWSLLTISVLLVIILLVGFFAFDKIKINNMNIQKELELLKEKSSYQMEIYKKKNEQEIELKKMYHDIKNLELLVGAYQVKGIDTKEVKEYIKKMKDYFSLEQDISTGNEILDLFLRDISSECTEKNIDFQYDVDFSKGKFINIVDIGTIFGNILSNAIEACEKIQETEKRKISLQVGSYEEFLIIKCKNSFTTLKMKNRKLLTTKSDEEFHGLGMICLRETLQNYQGEYSYKTENGEFILNAFIPIKNIKA